jgi:hypothetical protein
MLPRVRLGERLADQDRTENDDRQRAVRDRLRVPNPQGQIAGPQGRQHNEQATEIDHTDQFEQMHIVVRPSPSQHNQRHCDSGFAFPINRTETYGEQKRHPWQKLHAKSIIAALADTFPHRSMNPQR